MKMVIFSIGVIFIGFLFAVGLTLVGLVVMLFDASRREIGMKLLRQMWSWRWYFGKTNPNGVEAK